ncbi:MAG: ribosomal protein S18-alanine N-acetyltransferase [Pygmaiobacter massiliensis]|nr:ribosomal protein S18-alanine N-acetyltransferase [Pygmaiobacter massiliensis]
MMQQDDWQFLPLQPEWLKPLALLGQKAPDPWGLEDLAAEQKKPESMVLVALKQKIPFGYACFWRWQEEADLVNIVVDDKLRRQGVGKKLLKAGLSILQKEGCRRVTLEVRASNQPALVLYRGLGFAELARRPGLYCAPREDGFLMQLELAQEK